MPPDPAAEHIGIFSRFQYRAESLAHAVSDVTSWQTSAITLPNPAILASFRMVLIDMDATLQATFELIRAITARRPEAKVVALGFAESEENVVALGEAGASGYVTPGASLPGLIAVLRSVERCEFGCPPHITYALYSHLARLGSAHRSLRRFPILTAREQRVLDLLSQSLTNKEIAASLCISPYTAKNHVHRILKKLGWRSRNLAAGPDSRRRPPIAFLENSNRTGR